MAEDNEYNEHKSSWAKTLQVITDRIVLTLQGLSGGLHGYQRMAPVNDVTLELIYGNKAPAVERLPKSAI